MVPGNKQGQKESHIELKEKERKTNAEIKGTIWGTCKQTVSH